MFEPELEKIRAAAYPIKGACIAGGAITSVFTNKPINDVDIYFKDKKSFEDACYDAYDQSWWCCSVSKRAVTFSDNGSIHQFMHFDYFPKAEDIFKAFDFTICMAAYDFDTREFVFHDRFLAHNSQRYLEFNPGTKFPLASATRVLKYQPRGYTIGKGDLVKIVLASRATPINSWADLADQIGGAYGNKVELLAGDKEYSIEAAIELMSLKSTWADESNGGPSNVDDLLKKIAELKGEEYVERDFEAEWEAERLAKKAA